MISDTVDNIGLYLGNENPRIVHSLNFLADKPRWEALPTGEHDIGERVTLQVQSYTTLPREKTRWEAHEHCLDLQCAIEGTENFGIGCLDDFTRETEPKANNDIYFLNEREEGDGLFVKLSPGRFVIVGPGDVHMPKLQRGGPQKMKKFVFKIPVE